MILKSLKLKNIRSFEEVEIDFVKSNFITGWNEDTEDRNGCGKSTICDSILLLLGGASLSTLNLAKLIRTDEKEGSIEGIIETSNGDILEISRTLKTRGSGTLNVKVNGEDSNLSTSRDYQNLIFDYIEDADLFKKFRIVDKSIGTNILDFTAGQLRKTLMAMCQDKFETIRNNALERKREFEKFQKNVVLSSHAPSEKRLSIIEMAIADIESGQLNEIRKKVSEFQKEKSKYLSEKGKYSQQKEIKQNQINRLKSLNKCPTCLQSVPDEHKTKICSELQEEIKKANEKLSEVLTNLKIYDDIISCEDKKQTEIYRQKDKLKNLKYKLDTRLKQTNYKYTERDIELAKSAIEEIDKFANYYIIEWINAIEPIVNSYISVLNMKLHFNLDDRGNPSIEIHRDSKIEVYEQLSHGEKIFISFIFKIALLLEANKSGLIIADEGLDSLSMENLNRIVNIASNLPIQLILVSHNPEINIQRTHVISIIKKKGVSQIDSQN